MSDEGIEDCRGDVRRGITHGKMRLPMCVAKTLRNTIERIGQIASTTAHDVSPWGREGLDFNFADELK